MFFTEAELSDLEGHIAIGHNRYSTMGFKPPLNASLSKWAKAMTRSLWGTTATS